MLAELKVANLALIKSLTLSFGPGANIFTGETGAGKSILAGALGLIRGSKGSTELIRAGAPETKVEALFELERPEALEALFSELELEPSTEVVVQRTLSSAGRNRIRLNGAMATVSQLAAFGEELLAVSSQHDQQSLVREQKQLDFLDAFGQHQRLLSEMGAAYREREAANKSLNLLNQELKDGREKRELYEFQLAEIEKISPRPGEDQELSDVKAASKTTGKLLKILEDAEGILRGQGAGGLLDRLEHLSHLLGKASGFDERLNPLAETALECSNLISDLSANVAKLIKGQPTVANIEEVDDRISELAKLKRKYGPTLEQVLAKADTIRTTLSYLDSAALEAAKRTKALAIATQRTQAAALALRQVREQSAKRLTENLLATLKVLGFPKLTMNIVIEPQEDSRQAGETAGPKGADQVSFLFCPNLGEGLKPLSKIASGGELSRLMLALKIAKEPRSDQSLLFDEIDSGLSGATAEAVAAKMAELASRQQIFIITHLPQMASLPGCHFLAFKSPDESGNRTETSIIELDDDNRTIELARMLDGASPSPEALALSKRLLGL
jgi:DNA repair protein RecN (Recombination protein N)